MNKMHNFSRCYSYNFTRRANINLSKVNISISKDSSYTTEAVSFRQRHKSCKYFSLDYILYTNVYFQLLNNLLCFLKLSHCGRIKGKLKIVSEVIVCYPRQQKFQKYRILCLFFLSTVTCVGWLSSCALMGQDTNIRQAALNIHQCMYS